MYVRCIVSESDIWNSYVLTHTKETIAEPLTTLPTKELEAEALKLFKVGTVLHKFWEGMPYAQSIFAHISKHLEICQNFSAVHIFFVFRKVFLSFFLQ